jgi:hypothetical protein
MWATHLHALLIVVVCACACARARPPTSALGNDSRVLACAGRRA